MATPRRPYTPSPEPEDDLRALRRAFDEWAAGGAFDVRAVLRLDGAALQRWHLERERVYREGAWRA